MCLTKLLLALVLLIVWASIEMRLIHPPLPHPIAPDESSCWMLPSPARGFQVAHQRKYSTRHGKSRLRPLLRPNQANGGTTDVIVSSPFGWLNGQMWSTAICIEGNWLVCYLLVSEAYGNRCEPITTVPSELCNDNIVLSATGIFKRNQRHQCRSRVLTDPRARGFRFSSKTHGTKPASVLRQDVETARQKRGFLLILSDGGCLGLTTFRTILLFGNWLVPQSSEFWSRMQPLSNFLVMIAYGTALATNKLHSKGCVGISAGIRS
ncbi:uncharacterized protein J3D65DRAFT_269111 [Phyllosticta citribraziliensis]|uniref:Uncharacterized protein n=1 Tax=Phyllosticta citribraziliensis TaxID=989973 RepID=A0ABR1M302_9PEZI